MLKFVKKKHSPLSNPNGVEVEFRETDGTTDGEFCIVADTSGVKSCGESRYVCVTPSDFGELAKAIGDAGTEHTKLRAALRQKLLNK